MNENINDAGEFVANVSREELEHIESYIGKEIHCIKEYRSVEKGKFYKLKDMIFRAFDDRIKSIEELYKVYNPEVYYILIRCSGDSWYHYKHFFEHYELRTKEDIRRDKIKSILD